METELKGLQIDRGKRRGGDGESGWATKWIISGVTLFVLLGIGNFIFAKLNASLEVETVRARAKHEPAPARLNSLQRTADLARIGTRKEQVDAIRGQIVQAKGQLDFYQTQLSNTVIVAPIAGTILERNVERGEFVTNGFVGD